MIIKYKKNNRINFNYIYKNILFKKKKKNI